MQRAVSQNATRVSGFCVILLIVFRRWPWYVFCCASEAVGSRESMFLHRMPVRNRRLGFTLAEVLISVLIFGMVVGGLIYGYVQVNRMAAFSSMSLAAQSFASQGLEEAM